MSTRPQPRFGLLRIHPLQHAAALGPVVVQRHQALNLLGPQARLQALDQPRDAFAFTACRGEQFGVGRCAVRHVGAVQLQVERGGHELQVGQPLAQQHAHVRHIARRLGQRDVQLAGRRGGHITAVPRLVLHQQREAAHLHLPRGRPRHQPRQQDGRAVQHLLGGVGTRKQFEPALEHLGQVDPQTRVGALAQGAVQLVEQGLAEAPRQACARQPAQVAQGAQAHAFQRLPVLAAGAEQPHRRRVEPARQRGQVGAVQALARRCKPSQQGSALRGGRAGDLHTVAERCDGVAQALQQALRPAEITQAGLHVEQHAVRC